MEGRAVEGVLPGAQSDRGRVVDQHLLGETIRVPAPPVGLDVLIGLDLAVGPEVPPADVLLLAHPRPRARGRAPSAGRARRTA